MVFTQSPILFGWAKPVPYNPYNLRNKRWGEAFVAIAGSATNILLAVIFGLVVRYHMELGLGVPATTIAALISFINLFLGLFNLIPVPPLDGFTTLRSALPWHFSRGLAALEQRVQSAGIFSLLVFLILFSTIFSGPFYNLVIWLFGLLTGITSAGA